MSEKPHIIDVDYEVITPPHVQLMPARKVRRPLWFRLMQLSGLLLFVGGLCDIFSDGALSHAINHLLP